MGTGNWFEGVKPHGWEPQGVKELSSVRSRPETSEDFPGGNADRVRQQSPRSHQVTCHMDSGAGKDSGIRSAKAASELWPETFESWSRSLVTKGQERRDT